MFLDFSFFGGVQLDQCDSFSRIISILSATVGMVGRAWAAGLSVTVKIIDFNFLCITQTEKCSAPLNRAAHLTRLSHTAHTASLIIISRHLYQGLTQVLTKNQSLVSINRHK